MQRRYDVKSVRNANANENTISHCPIQYVNGILIIDVERNRELTIFQLTKKKQDQEKLHTKNGTLPKVEELISQP